MSVDSIVHVHTYTVCTYVRTQTRSAKTIVSLLFPVQLNCTFENYKLRSRSKKQYKPPVKRARYNSSDEDDKAMPGEGSLPSQPPVKRGRGQGSRGRGGGRAGRGSQGHGRGYEGRGRRVRGIGRGMRGRGVYGRGRGCRGDGASGRSKKAGSGGLPTGATTISTPDSKYKDSDGFCPLHDDGPHLPAGAQASALELFELFFNDSIMDRIL